MLPLDLTLAFIAGQFLAYAAKTQLKQDNSFYFNTYFMYGLLWLGLFLVPSIMWAMDKWPFFETMYFFSPETLPNYTIALFAVGLLIAFALGYYIANYFITNGKEINVLITSLVLFVLIIIVITLLGDRSFVVGTYDEWVAGTATPVLESDLFRTVLLTGSLDLISLLYLYYRINKEKTNVVQ